MIMVQTNRIKETILVKARERGIAKSTCPSEIARVLFPQNWRGHMGEVRAAAFKLRDDGQVIITQKGVPVDPATVKGPIRIKVA